MDGTLVDTAPSIAAALSQIRAERGRGPISEEQVRPWISLGAPELIRLSLGGAASDVDADVKALRRALKDAPTPPGSLYPHVRETLHALWSAGFKLAVVTNKPEALARKVLDDLALIPLFRAVVGGDSTPHAKPHAAPLLAALAILEITPENALLVGDSAIDGAAAAGLEMAFHFFEGGYGSADCDFPIASRFADHADLLPVLLTLAAAT